MHGVSSFFGTLSIGLFAYRGQKSGSTFSFLARIARPYQNGCAGAGLTNGRGLFFGGGIELLLIQLLALVVCAAWAASMTWIIVEGVQRAGVQLRPPEGHEEHGIDFVSHGER